MMATYNSCQGQPTLLIGLGGLGSRIADGIYGNVKDRGNVTAFSIDSDLHDAEKLEHADFISIAASGTVQELIRHWPDATNWLPNDPAILTQNLDKRGSGGLRITGRLLYEHALRNGKFEFLLAVVRKLGVECSVRNCPMRVSILSSLCGGTGSGIFLQVALLIREQLRKHFPNIKVEIHGEFFLPSAFSWISETLTQIVNTMSANVYAALKELSAINHLYMNGGTPLELTYSNEQPPGEIAPATDLPFDDCYLYDRQHLMAPIRQSDLENAMIKRMLSNVTISSLTEISVTEFCVGIEPDKLLSSASKYFRSYQALLANLPAVITPHLHKDWHWELPNIGEPVFPAKKPQPTPASKGIPKEYFVFISYSTQDTQTANQLKQILETNGVPCWMAPQSIPAGSDYGREIPKAIDQCAVFLLLLSNASQHSFWVPKEVGRAIGKGKTVVPFQIDNATISDAFNFYLTNSQRISAYNRMTEAYRELLSRLKDILPDGTARHTTSAVDAVKGKEAEPVVFDMRQVRTFASCGNETTVFKVKKAPDGQSIALTVNFEKTRLRDEIPQYAGAYYLQHPAVDVSQLSQLSFRARSEDGSIETIWVEIKPEGKAWMHESFDFCLTSEWEEYVIDFADFQFPDTAICLEEITFVLKPGSFTSETSLTGNMELGGLSIR